MHVELDHLFNCVQPDAAAAGRLARLGLVEGRLRRHQGQDTAKKSS